MKMRMGGFLPINVKIQNLEISVSKKRNPGRFWPGSFRPGHFGHLWGGAFRPWKVCRFGLTFGVVRFGPS